MASPNEEMNHQNQENVDNKRNGPNQETNTQPQRPNYRNAREYAQALRPWLWQYYSSYAMHSFATNCAMQMQAMSHFAYTNSLNNNYCSAAPSTYLRSRNDPYVNRRPPLQPNGTVPQQGQQNANVRQAEGVLPQGQDAQACTDLNTILIYACSSFIASDDIFDSFNDLDFERAFAITFEVIALEIINRVLITIFETMCICRTIGQGVAIGATPGKRMMGLRVVSCDNVVSVDQDRVRVSPAGNVGFKNAFLRSAIKNFTIAFFLPACLTVFFFKHNRTAYDVVSRTIVVEDRA
ncbi:protein FAM8A1 [Elysia marginata]|uniref:Protein FAM8A1 n=1 Tax=Elysia marginata TaxID=1093978 RepID=A0AAV4HR99_9GAST|nr:protein FAM8A1 [Elysia marginata]